MLYIRWGCWVITCKYFPKGTTEIFIEKCVYNRVTRGIEIAKPSYDTDYYGIKET